MGVKGLWELLAPGGKRVPLEKIDGMRLAIDLSVWLMRMATALGDKSGAGVENPHLIGVFTRCCKLAFYGARPVFVFDGKAPRLKDATLRKRRQLRQTKERELERIAKRLVTKELLRKAMIRAAEKEDEENAKKKSKNEEEQLPKIDYNQKIQPWNEEPDSFSSFFISELDTTNSGIDDSDTEIGFLSTEKSNLSPSQKERLKELKAAKEETESKAELEAIVAQKSLSMLRSEDKVPTKGEIDSAQDFSKAQLSNFLLKTSINREIYNIEKSCNNNSSGRKTIASDRNTQYIYIKDYKGPTDISRTKESNSVVGKDEDFEVILDENSKPNDFIFDSSMFDSGEAKEEEFEVTLNENAAQRSSIFDSTMFDVNDIDEDNDEITLNKELSNEDKPINNTEKPKSTLFNSSMFNIDEKKDDIEITLNRELSNEDKPINKTEKPKQSIFDSFMFDIDEKKDNIEITLNKEHPISNEQDNSESPKSPIFGSTTLDEKENDINTLKENDDKEREPSLFESMLLGIDDDSSHLNDLILDDSTFDNDTTFDPELPETKDVETNDVPDGDFLKSLDELTADIEKYKQKYDSRARGLLSVDGKTIAELNSQVQYLLDLFGVPYVCSPSEADAQCAYLNYSGLVDAVVSDDVDVFLFGAQTVYRYLFSMNSIMEEYTSEGIQSRTGLTREDLQKLALFLGSDYTIGVHGVGRVHALEIITAFPDLTDFRRWCNGDPMAKKTAFELGKGVVNLRPFLKVPDSFPSRAVLNAYQTPRVDFIQEPFEWKRPNIDELRKFAILYFGWPLEKIDKLLEPVIVRATMMGSVPKNPSANGIADIRNFFVVQDNGDKEKREIGFSNGTEIANRLSKRINEIYHIRTHK